MGGVLSWEVGGFFKYIEGSLQYVVLISGLGIVGDFGFCNWEFWLFSGNGWDYGVEVFICKAGDWYSSWLFYILSCFL